MRRQRKTVPDDDVLDQLVAIGDQLESSVAALRSLVAELRADVPPEHRSPVSLVEPPVMEDPS